METLEPFNIIYQTAEDGLGDTVKPRLMEADADLEDVYKRQGRDADALTSAFTEYTNKKVKKVEKSEHPSVLAKLSQFKELVDVYKRQQPCCSETRTVLIRKEDNELCTNLKHISTALAEENTLYPE